MMSEGIHFLTVLIQKGSINVAGQSQPLVHAARTGVLNSVFLDIELPIKGRLKEVNFLHVILLPLQSRVDVCHRKTQPLHRVGSSYLPLSVKHPVAVTCNRNKNKSDYMWIVFTKMIKMHFLNIENHVDPFGK